MRRVRLVRALVMRGQSHCQTSGVKVGRERGQYTWTSPHPAGTSLASPNLKSAGRGAQRKQSQRSVSPAQNVAEKGRKLIQTWKVGNPSRADAGGADWLPHVDPDLREMEPSKGVVRRMPLNARSIFSRKHKTARASIEGTNSERVTEMG